MSGQLQAEITVIRQSGLLLSAWYKSQHKEIAAGDDGTAHFCQAGWRRGAKPNPYFDPGWYLAQNPDVAAAGFNPLVHYAAYGEAEGRDPCPYFFVSWYRASYGLGPAEPCLKHYLERRTTGQVNPVPVFDGAFYLDMNPDVAAGGADPFEHFLIFGVTEGRDPAPDFDIKFYTARYGATLAGQNPLLHYLANRESEDFLTQRPAHEAKTPGAVRFATRPAKSFEDFRPIPAQAPRKAKLLAFYLPQFHAVPENDAWWGQGFTDWTNLGRAQPRFGGHLQPRIPRDLGYYSLDDPATLRKQIDLAAGAGLHGFVFYFYWFNRHRLLEKPLEQLLGDKSLDFPFCVMWANENWTRRWDGLERQVLIAQEYKPEDDEALIGAFARLFADARYIRVQGRALLMIYRPGLIPGARQRIAAWRALFRERHGEDPVIIMAQSVGEDYDPTPYGLDGAVEFPPHKLSQATAVIDHADLTLLDEGFGAKVHDYEAIAKTSLAFEVPDYPLIKTIVPGWDNDPRREGQGLVLHNIGPDKYQRWLEALIGYTAKHDFFGERIIAVNAWNEWAEGAFLEPDLHFGAAFLNATGRALTGSAHAEQKRKILLVGHDAQPHGAQLLLLHIAEALRERWGLEVHVLLLGVGPLLGRYREAAIVTVASDKTVIGEHLDGFRAMGIRVVIANSAGSARMVPWAARRGMKTTLLVHEMPQLLRAYNLEIQARLGAAAAETVVFAADEVAQRFAEAVDLPVTNRLILPQGNYQRLGFDALARARARAELGIAAGDFIVLGAGFGDIRKGFDIFLSLARKLSASRPDVRFFWVGDIQPTLATYLAADMRAAGNFFHIPFTGKVAEFFSAADVFALTSREDPYPTVVMEAFCTGMPCVAFEGSGGIPDLIRREDAGRVASAGDADDFLAQIVSLLDHEALAALRPGLAARAAQTFDFDDYIERLLGLVLPDVRKVSVAVLNYNYARYLPERLSSIFAQTYPVAEVLVLDDASTDDSLEVVQRVARRAKRDVRVMANAANSGSPFAQWRRAAEAATGEFLWLCEADDAASPSFLARLVDAMGASDAALIGLTDSAVIDGAGKVLSPDYQSYYIESGVRELAISGNWEAKTFAQRVLSIRNLILNVSAVLWRREALLKALDAVPDLTNWRLAGDWRLYLALLAGQPGQVIYVAAPLNTHRRHEAGVTKKLDAETHLGEIIAMHKIAAESLDLDAPRRAQQAEYQALIARQFGLSKTTQVARKRKV